MRWSEEQIWETARLLGLDPYPTEFHVVPAHVLYAVAASGIPGHYSHWSQGKNYWQHMLRHQHHMGRIYEMVLNANPSMAFLLDTNSDVITCMVMAHVLAHVDFFRHNRAFTGSERRMPEMAVLRAERIRHYEERYGVDVVETFLDAVRTVELHVDAAGYHPDLTEDPTPDPAPYDDLLAVERPAPERRRPDYTERRRKAGLPCADVLGFLIAEAPLDDWQRDVADIVREDGLYYQPYVRTKVVNEGWASFWHSEILRRLDLTDGEWTEYARVNAGVVGAHPGAINPYWLGLQILRDVERRFGRERLFEVRRLETDATLVRNYLTRNLVEELHLIRYGPVEDKVVVTEDKWETIRDAIANEFAAKLPEIVVADRDHDGQGGLLLEHRHDGRPLLLRDVEKVLEQLQRIWRRPVHLRTVHDEELVILSHDGKEAQRRSVAVKAG